MEFLNIAAKIARKATILNPRYEFCGVDKPINFGHPIVTKIASIDASITAKFAEMRALSASKRAKHKPLIVSNKFVFIRQIFAIVIGKLLSFCGITALFCHVL